MQNELKNKVLDFIKNYSDDYHRELSDGVVSIAETKEPEYRFAELIADEIGANADDVYGVIVSMLRSGELEMDLLEVVNPESEDKHTYYVHVLSTHDDWYALSIDDLEPITWDVDWEHARIKFHCEDFRESDTVVYKVDLDMDPNFESEEVAQFAVDHIAYEHALEDKELMKLRKKLEDDLFDVVERIIYLHRFVAYAEYHCGIVCDAEHMYDVIDDMDIRDLVFERRIDNQIFEAVKAMNSLSGFEQLKAAEKILVRLCFWEETMLDKE